MTPPVDTNPLEEGLAQQLDFDKVAKIGRAGHQVVPVVLQDTDSGEVLFIGYANEEAYRLTLERRSAVLYSTSREEIWHKMLAIRADMVFSIGLLSGVPQPVVINTKLANVPKKGIYNWDPGAHFGIYRPDTFWLKP